LTICLQRLKKIELSARPSAEIEFKIATGSDGGYRHRSYAPNCNNSKAICSLVGELPPKQLSALRVSILRSFWASTYFLSCSSVTRRKIRQNTLQSKTQVLSIFSLIVEQTHMRFKRHTLVAASCSNSC